MISDLQKARRRWFQTLDPVLPEEMVGLWRGEGIPADHPLDGVLENLQWFGKHIHPDFKADALFSNRGRRGWFRSNRPLSPSER
jgi:hypothetical protein